MERNVVKLANTNFIFRTNFSGDPTKDRFNSASRKGNIIIPSQELAEQLAAMGANVKQTKPKEGEEEGYVPEYYVSCIVNFHSPVAESRPPKVCLVTGGVPRDLTEETVGLIDSAYVTKVNATIQVAYIQKYDRYACYILSLYVEQDAADDPFAELYRKPENEELPFPMED